MGDKTEIEWTDSTWPVVTGCHTLSPGCDNCYSERLTATRLRSVPAYAGLTDEHGKWTGEVRLHPDRLDWPLRWRKPRRIFVCSMSDLFHPAVPDEFIAQVWARMAWRPQHQFQVLTKRAQRMGRLVATREFRHRVIEECWYHPTGHGAYMDWPLPNVWLGVSVESQEYAFRIRHLLDAPAAVHFVSAEPLIDGIDIGEYLGPDRVNWVICGGESGQHARPMHPDWARALRDQCREAGVPYLFKQHGEWAPGPIVPPSHAGSWRYALSPATAGSAICFEGGQTMERIGKRKAGRLLDGRTWDEYPQELQV